MRWIFTGWCMCGGEGDEELELKMKARDWYRSSMGLRLIRSWSHPGWSRIASRSWAHFAPFEKDRAVPCAWAVAGACGSAATGSRAVSPAHSCPPKSKMTVFEVQAIWCADVSGYVGNNCVLYLAVLAGLVSSHEVNTLTLISTGAVP